MNSIDRYLVPGSIAEALEILRGGEVTILAGGTDLMPQSKSGKAKFHATLMNVRRIGEMGGIRRVGNTFEIGALTTIAELRDSEEIRRVFPALWQACDCFASGQVRNAATIGGNLCNASPAGDSHVPLLVYDAHVILATKPNGSVQVRKVPLSEFLVGPGKTCRADYELVTGIELDAPPPGHCGVFYKFGTRPALDISAISIALCGERRDGALHNARVAIGAAAPTAVRSSQVEAALEGKQLDATTIGAAASAAEADIKPISDVRASAWYRRELVRNTIERMLNDVAHG